MTRRVLPVAFAVAACAACYSWAPAPSGVPDANTLAETDMVRVTPREGHPLSLKSPSIEGDSMIGTDVILKARSAIALDEIKSLEVRQINKSQTLGATFAGIAAIGAVVIGLSLAALSSAPL